MGDQLKAKEAIWRFAQSRALRGALLAFGLAILYFGWALDHVEQNTWLLKFMTPDYVRAMGAYGDLLSGETELTSEKPGFIELAALLRARLVVQREQSEAPLDSALDLHDVELLSIRAQGEVPWLVTPAGYSGPGIRDLEVTVEIEGRPQTIGPSDFPGLEAEIRARYLTQDVFSYSSAFFLAGLVLGFLTGLMEILCVRSSRAANRRAGRSFSAWLSMRWAVLTLAVLAVAATFAILLMALVTTPRLQEDARASVLATIGTGLAVLLVTSIALGLDFARYRRSREPRLGVIWTERGVYPLTEHASDRPVEFSVEHVLWNAGATPIVLLQPAIAPIDGIQLHSLSTERNEVLLLRGTEWVEQKAFPMVLAERETALWRFWPGDKASLPPIMAHTVGRDKAKAVDFVRKNKNARCFLFDITCFSALPADVRNSDLHHSFVGFTYKLGDNANESEE